MASSAFLAAKNLWKTSTEKPSRLRRKANGLFASKKALWNFGEGERNVWESGPLENGTDRSFMHFPSCHSRFFLDPMESLLHHTESTAMLLFWFLSEIYVVCKKTISSASSKMSFVLCKALSFDFPSTTLKRLSANFEKTSPVFWTLRRLRALGTFRI